MFADVLFVLDELVAQKLFEVCADALQAGNAVGDVAGQMETIQIVEYGHVEGSGGCSFFLVSADMEIVVIGAAIGEAVNERGIAVVGKDDGLVDRKQGVEIAIGEAVGMLGGSLDGHQVNDIDDSNFDIGEMAAEEIHGG